MTSLRASHGQRAVPVFAPGEYYWNVRQAVSIADLTLAELESNGAAATTDHAHELAYIQLVIQGRWAYGYGRVTEAVEPWLASFHPANEVHRSDGTTDAVRTFEVGLGKSWTDRLSANQLFDLRARQRTKSREAVRVLLRLRQELEALDPWSPWTIEGLVLEAAVEIGRARSRRTRRGVAGWMTRLESMLRDDTAATTSLSEISDRLGIDPSAMSREFRRQHGCTPSEYVRRHRVERATLDIASTDDSLSTIALKHGFADQSHLTRMFRQYNGVTPGAFRRGARPGRRANAGSAHSGSLALE